MQNQNNFEENKKMGCFQISRSIFNSDIWTTKPAWWSKVWIYIIGRANHTDHKQIRRGECFITYSEIYNACNLAKEGLKPNCLDGAIRFLKKDGKLATQKTTRGMVISVLNYDVYQTINNYKSDTESETKATQRAKKSDTIYKNDIKNDNNDYIDTASSEQSSQTVELINIFKPINPTINFGNKTIRESCKRLISKFGFEKTVRVAKYAASVQGQRYAPTITTPHQLETKFGELMTFYKKEANKQVQSL